MDYHFCGLSQPFDILGQKNYGINETSLGHYFRILGGSKEIFLKNFLETLFIGSNEATLFISDNIILVDDNPEKSFCNENGNSMFFWI